MNVVRLCIRFDWCVLSISHKTLIELYVPPAHLGSVHRQWRPFLIRPHNLYTYYILAFVLSIWIKEVLVNDCICRVGGKFQIKLIKGIIKSFNFSYRKLIVIHLYAFKNLNSLIKLLIH